MSEIHLPSLYEQPLRDELQEAVGQWHEQVAKLLPTLPSEVDIEFDNDYLTPGFGTGGAAFGLHAMKLAYDPAFSATQDELLVELREVYFHESYHLARGFSFETTPDDLPAINLAIEEGLATKFEIAHANAKPGHGEYEDRETMLAWLKEVRDLPDGFDYDWEHWKYFDPETGRKWILYKVGLFVVDEALSNNPKLTIETIAVLTVQEIIALSKL